jgi:hypothetical protein
MKHENVIMYDAFLWNKNNSAIRDDVIIWFIASGIKEIIGDEIKWHTIEEWITIGTHPKVTSCIKFINGTFIEIYKPWNNDIHGSWFNEHKKMYYMNNMVVFNHHGLFIYLDDGYLDPFHDVNNQQESKLYRN